MTTKQRGVTTADVKTLGHRLEATIKENTREIVAHFNASQGKQNEWIKEEFRKVDERFGKVDHEFEQIHQQFEEVNGHFEEIQAELEAIKSMLIMRQELRNLVRELKLKGITLDESQIFAK